MEIGSEYWTYEGELRNNNSNFWNIGKDNKFTISGRTAIHYVLKNILQRKKIQNVYFPSYCCESMKKPFEDLNIKIEFYDVKYDGRIKYDIEINKKCDIFFAMNYFGYVDTNMEFYIDIFKKNGSIIIEDITQSLLSDKQFCNKSDYLIGSLRKWFPIASGGIAVCLCNKFDIALEEKTMNEIIEIKKIAMQNKRNYIEKNIGDKQIFLEQYNKSNMLLKDNYKMYSIDKDSYNIIMKIDIELIKKKRKENANHIYECLKANKNIKMLISQKKQQDCPLFVPILFAGDKRDYVRKKLIENDIYLPIHWNDSSENAIAKYELSIICDQRYGKSDIERICNIINKEVEKKDEYILYI